MFNLRWHRHRCIIIIDAVIPFERRKIYAALSPAAVADIPFAVHITNDFSGMRIDFGDLVFESPFEWVIAAIDTRTAVIVPRPDEEIIK